jgi:hypothetical protein
LRSEVQQGKRVQVRTHRVRCHLSQPIVTVVTPPCPLAHCHRHRRPHPVSYPIIKPNGVCVSRFDDGPGLCATIVADFMDTRAVKKALILCGLLLCLLFGAAAQSTAANDLALLSAPQSSTGPSLALPYFAIGDFDGDQKPDLATVQVDPYTQRDSRYSIHLQLSFGASSAIGLTAPFGGLLLSAKDVNGDSAIDLVVTTAVGHKLVTVLVNDGHGNFTFAEEGAFPELSPESDCHVDAPPAPSSRPTSLLQSRYPFGEEGEDSTRSDAPAPTERFFSAGHQDSPRWRVGATSGRSPPAACILP